MFISSTFLYMFKPLLTYRFLFPFLFPSFLSFIPSSFLFSLVILFLLLLKKLDNLPFRIPPRLDFAKWYLIYSSSPELSVNLQSDLNTWTGSAFLIFVSFWQDTISDGVPFHHEAQWYLIPSFHNVDMLKIA